MQYNYIRTIFLRCPINLSFRWRRSLSPSRFCRMMHIPFHVLSDFFFSSSWIDLSTNSITSNLQCLCDGESFYLWSTEASNDCNSMHLNMWYAIMYKPMDGPTPNWKRNLHAKANKSDIALPPTLCPAFGVLPPPPLRFLWATPPCNHAQSSEGK